MKRPTEKRIRAVCAIMAVLMAVTLSACGQKSGSAALPGAAEAVQEEPALPPVEVSMPEYELAYSGELKDVLHMEKTEEKDGLDFFANISGSDVRVFTLHYNTAQGDFVTVLRDGKGSEIPVAFEMTQMPEGLSEEEENIFYLAQEAVNEIAESLTLK